MSAPLIVVLGGEGLIGRAVRDRLRGERELLSVDIQPAAPTEDRTLTLDMGDADDIDRLFVHLAAERDRVAGVVNLVAHYDFENAHDPRYDAVEAGLERILARWGEVMPARAPFAFSSSMAALEPTEPGQRLTPESPRSGAWAYPAHKIRCEAIIEAADIPQARLELVLAGVYTEWAELVPLYQQIERVRTSPLKRSLYPGPTDRGLTYVHVEDVGEAFAVALEASAEASGVHRHLIGETQPVTYRQIQDAAAEALLGRRVPTLRVPKLLAREGARVTSWLAAARGEREFIQPWMVDFAGEHFEFDISSSTAQLGWSPRHHLGDELPGICARARTHPDEWRRRNGARPF